MLMKNGSSMTPSTVDLIALAEAVESRFKDLTAAYFRIRGRELLPPKYLDKDMLLWRTMRVRHRRGDFRNTEDEKNSTRRVAQWTFDENCDLRNQPRKPLLWAD